MKEEPIMKMGAAFAIGALELCPSARFASLTSTSLLAALIIKQQWFLADQQIFWVFDFFQS